MKRKIHAIVLEIIEQLRNENTRLSEEYNRQIAFNKNQKALMDSGQIDEYDIAEVERPKMVTVPNPHRITDEVVKMLNALANSHQEDPDIDGVVIEEYKTPQEKAAENEEEEEEPVAVKRAAPPKRKPAESAGRDQES